jgi:very-short-patch-repair endonuclease
MGPLSLSLQRAVAAGDYTARSWNTPLNAYEQDLQAAMQCAGVPVIAQLGVSTDGIRHDRYHTYRLDFACRYRQSGLLVDIEMDGRGHRTASGQEHDHTRNEILRARGWYILRVPSAVKQHGLLDAVVQDLRREMAWHWQAAALAHVGTQRLADMLAQITRRTGDPVRLIVGAPFGLLRHQLTLPGAMLNTCYLP